MRRDMEAEDEGEEEEEEHVDEEDEYSWTIHTCTYICCACVLVSLHMHTSYAILAFINRSTIECFSRAPGKCARREISIKGSIVA